MASQAADRRWQPRSSIVVHVRTSGSRGSQEVLGKDHGQSADRAYDIIRARGDLGDPQWPDHSFESLIKLAFRDNLIDSADHAVVRDLYGDI
jgi:hypothetical protein